MYAVIETGGKQYRVEVGTELEIELLEAGPGETVAFDRILLIADGEAASIGRPVVDNASVSGEILRRERGEKLISFKYRPKARSRVKKGHRQELTVVRISDIVLDGKSAAKDLAAVEKERATERQRLQEAAKRQAEQDAALAAKLAADAEATAEAEKAEKADKPAKAVKAVKATTATTADKPKKAARAETTDTVARKATGKTKATDAAKAPRSRMSDKD
ncbi:MAG TPA: 50S ribosomal protein L21 [Candidatus Limnocylindria bacterium]|nr:50S ribosomal protein L21 [Candidatus Limnocylindria bacterium]